MIGRRRLVSGFACAIGTAALAQVPRRTYRIAYIGLTAKNSADDDRILAAFIHRLGELGFVVGTNLTIDWRFSEGKNERYAEFAKEMRDKGVDLVVGNSTAARAMVDVGGNIPVVMFGVIDPIGTGLVASFAHPGGQVTGMSGFSGDLVPKQIELLKAAAPGVTKIALSRCPECGRLSGLSTARIEATFESYRERARSLGLSAIALDINAVTDFPAAVSTIKSEGVNGVLLLPQQVNAGLRDDWVAFEAEQRIPVITGYRGLGCLLSYGPDGVALFRRLAEMVVQILNGAKPGDLALEQPTKLEFVIDLKVAKAIGLTIPQSALLRADEVIS
ncbi:ABC transporter substrate-binding protein [Variovorax sp. Sphag1AA]|uniref:ABC transporter substrate-binding protein n=1 Tax=Variovorax sp. Sphag1AA TaxID=2587027 RepID=UPI0016073351|nr:ABC transporter substrate-binding protein [Variovorax sp. Sphag1AA]MBB3179291.1 putative ABC transport system substrate-binding protein [Variovorax sp. Sphag1AA]